MYKTAKIALASAASLSFVLAACGGEAEEVETEAVEAEEVSVTDTEFDPMTRDYELSEDATTRRADFDEEAFNTEYSGYRDEIVNEQDSEENLAEERRMRDEATGDLEGSRGNVDTTPERDTNTNMRKRSNMTWRYLDRNGDNQLSVAEYAIWAVPLDPTNPKPNDQAPYVTPDQANKAADSFFYYDTDGDTYLSRQEFSNARLGRNIG